MGDFDEVLEFGANATERKFARALGKRAGKCLRAGWPDFLVELDGKTICVEVKTGRDVVRPNQAKMFAALERGGLRVYVWNPAKPKVLTPWATYSPGKPSRFGKIPIAPRRT